MGMSPWVRVGPEISYMTDTRCGCTLCLHRSSVGLTPPHNSVSDCNLQLLSTVKEGKAVGKFLGKAMLRMAELIISSMSPVDSNVTSDFCFAFEGIPWI